MIPNAGTDGPGEDIAATDDGGRGHGMGQVQDYELPWMGGSRKYRFWPTWDEAQQSLVGRKPLADVARALQPLQ